MRLALCNEVIAEMPYAKQCEYAAKLGYDGLEVAPYTLAESPERMTPAQVAEARRATADAGIAVTGLHWLLVKPAGLSISTRDDAVRKRTLDVMLALTSAPNWAAGTSCMVHPGSGASMRATRTQRRLRARRLAGPRRESMRPRRASSTAWSRSPPKPRRL